MLVCFVDDSQGCVIKQNTNEVFSALSSETITYPVLYIDIYKISSRQSLHPIPVVFNESSHLMQCCYFSEKIISEHISRNDFLHC